MSPLEILGTVGVVASLNIVFFSKPDSIKGYCGIAVFIMSLSLLCLP